MFWFVNEHNIFITTMLDDLRIQTVLEAGFLRHSLNTSFPHDHLNCELYFVNRGQYTTRCGGRDYTTEQSDILLIGSGIRHSVVQLSEDALAYSLRFSFYPTNGQNSPLYSRLSSRLSAPVLLRGQEHLLSLLNQLRQELASQQPLHNTAVDALLQLFYTRLLRTVLEIPAPSSLQQPFSIDLPASPPIHLCDTVPQEFYMAALDSFFTTFPLQHATLTNLTRCLHLSTSQTQRLIKTYYGVSFREKLIRAKVERSRFLMSTTDLSLEAIAEQTGYSSYNAFFDAFTARTGQTPSQYRQSFAKE